VTIDEKLVLQQYPEV